MEYLFPGGMVKYLTGGLIHQFNILKDFTKGYVWGENCKILILGQEETLVVGEELLNPIKITSQLPNNL